MGHFIKEIIKQQTLSELAECRQLLQLTRCHQPGFSVLQKSLSRKPFGTKRSTWCLIASQRHLPGAP